MSADDKMEVLVNAEDEKDSCNAADDTEEIEIEVVKELNKGNKEQEIIEKKETGTTEEGNIQDVEPKKRVSKRLMSLTPSQESTTYSKPEIRPRKSSLEQEPIKLKLKLNKGVATKVDMSDDDEENGDEARPRKRPKREKKVTVAERDFNSGDEDNDDEEEDEEEEENSEDDNVEDNGFTEKDQIESKRLRRKVVDDEKKKTAVDSKKKRVSVGKTVGKQQEDNEEKSFCWTCHKVGASQRCSTCPREFHPKCVQFSTESDKGFCPECTLITSEENNKTHLMLDRLNTLLGFTLKRMKSVPEAEEFSKAVDPNDEPSYLKYVKHPMDLKQLKKNIDAKLYKCTAAFLADTRWLLHNSIIFNSNNSKITSMARFLVKICRQELAEIDNCSDCYYNAHTKNDWFLHVCRKPHLLVWARLKGYPFWPAKLVALNPKSQMVDARFFGEHDKAWVPVKECFLLSVTPPPSGAKKRNDIEFAFDEMKRHIKRISKKYGRFIFAPDRTPLDPDRIDEQLSQMIPGWAPNMQTIDVSSDVVIDNVIEQVEPDVNSPEEEIVRNLVEQAKKTRTKDNIGDANKGILTEISDDTSTDCDETRSTGSAAGIKIPEHAYSRKNSKTTAAKSSLDTSEVDSSNNDTANVCAPENKEKVDAEPEEDEETRKKREEPTSTTPDTTTALPATNEENVSPLNSTVTTTTNIVNPGDFLRVEVKQENFEQYLEEESQDVSMQQQQPQEIKEQQQKPNVFKPQNKKNEGKSKNLIQKNVISSGVIKVRRDVFVTSPLQKQQQQRPMLTIVDIDQMRSRVNRNSSKTYLGIRERRKRLSMVDEKLKDTTRTSSPPPATDMRLSDEVSLLVVSNDRRPDFDSSLAPPDCTTSTSPPPIEASKKGTCDNSAFISLTSSPSSSPSSMSSFSSLSSLSNASSSSITIIETNTNNKRKLPEHVKKKKKQKENLMESLKLKEVRKNPQNSFNNNDVSSINDSSNNKQISVSASATTATATLTTSSITTNVPPTAVLNVLPAGSGVSNVTPSINGPLIFSNNAPAFLTSAAAPSNSTTASMPQQQQHSNIAFCTQNNLGQLSLLHLTNLTSGIQTNFVNLAGETLGYNSSGPFSTLYAAPSLAGVTPTTVPITTPSGNATTTQASGGSKKTGSGAGSISVRTLSSLGVVHCGSPPPPPLAPTSISSPNTLPPPPQLQTKPISVTSTATSQVVVIKTPSEDITSEINKHTNLITEVVRESLESLLSELGNKGMLEAKVKSLLLEKERRISKHKQTILEMRQQHEASLREMRLQFDQEKAKAVAEIRLQAEKTLADAKKKQWCARCGKEALFYCCWNTSYCNYPCQQQHWPLHMTSCGQLPASGNNSQHLQQQQQQQQQQTQQHHSAPNMTRSIKPCNTYPSAVVVSSSYIPIHLNYSNCNSNSNSGAKLLTTPSPSASSSAPNKNTATVIAKKNDSNSANSSTNNSSLIRPQAASQQQYFSPT